MGQFQVRTDLALETREKFQEDNVEIKGVRVEEERIPESEIKITNVFIETENGYSGTVSEVNIFSTKLTTTDNRLIIIPNGSLSNGTVNNYSGNRMRRIEWLVGVEYGTDSEQVKNALKEIVAGESRTLYTATGAPADPLIEVNALLDSAVQYVVRIWVKSEDYWPVYYRLNEQIYTILPQKGIDFPFPQLDVRMVKEN